MERSISTAGACGWLATLGVVLTALAWTAAKTGDQSLPALMVAAGLLAAAGSAALRPASWLVLASAAVSAGLAAEALDPSSDSLRMALRVVSVVAAAGAILVQLPKSIARFAISLFVLFHFGGILVAITSITLPSTPAPWLSNQLWFRVYRPYLQFMYLNNAYHFYAPEPGPATILWACVRYTDGRSEWVETPDPRAIDKDPLRLEYFRRLAMVQTANTPVYLPQIPVEVVQARLWAGQRIGLPSPEQIKRYLPTASQYLVLTDNCQKILESFARHLASDTPSGKPGVRVASVCLYMAVHSIGSAKDFADAADPGDPVSYLPYFQGEFDSDGTLVNPHDPLLHWLIPILRESAGNGQALVRNYVAVHAASKSSSKAEP